MAWELPNEPIHLDEALQGAYENGDLPLLNRNDDSNTTTTTTSTTPWPHADRYYTAPQNRTEFAQKVAANPDNYYYINNRADVNRYSPATRPANQYYYNSPPIVQQPAAASLAKPAVAFVSNAIDSFSNKLDYYFSKADKVIGSIRDMATAGNRPRPAANPWSNQAPRYVTFPRKTRRGNKELIFTDNRLVDRTKVGSSQVSSDNGQSRKR